MTTSTTGMQRRSDSNRFAPAAFTLVELILVMVLLTTLLVLAAPSLSRSFRQHNLEQEAARLLAMTEYGRDEAVSQGVPTTVWIDPVTGSFGVEAQTGYAADETRRKEYRLSADVHFDLSQALVVQGGLVDAVQFDPDGTPDPTSMVAIRIVDKSNSAVTLTRTADGWSYEIVKEMP